jgi:hypothetical protein
MKITDCRTFQSVREFTDLATTLLYRADESDMLSDQHYLYEVITALETALDDMPSDDGVKDRMVYVIVPKDYSWARLGQGQWDRPLATQTAFLMEWSGYSAQRREGGKRFWPIQPSLVKLIAANGGVVCWFPLLENLTSQQARSGERALFDRYGLSKWGGLWINEIEA